MEVLISSLSPPPPTTTSLRRLRRHVITSSAAALQSSTLEALDWPAVCTQVSAFTSTPISLSLSLSSPSLLLPLGRSPDASRTLLRQTDAAAALPRPLDFSGVEDVAPVVGRAVAGTVLMAGEICAVRRTLGAARGLLRQLRDHGDSSDRYQPLLDILRNCNFMGQLEQKIEFCIDCNLSVILDRASEDLEIIRSERKRNMEKLDCLLKEESGRIFQKGGIDKPLVTKRRSRMCVGIKASHRSLLPGGIVLNTSNSGATYFMEPKEAVELNNMEVRLSNSEKMEEHAILSMLTAEIADLKIEFRNLLDKILELDLAFARAGHGQWINGICPILISEGGESDNTDYSLAIDIEAIQHPLLLETTLGSPSGLIAFKSERVNHFIEGNRVGKTEMDSDSSNFPVPIDIKIGCKTKVVVISGPNTGGKTASMKTLGLASVMSKAGMFLPAKRQARIPWFDFILADIGDHQSLEKNLSTFSGHISQLCKILEVASNRSLVLIDEIGSGTDPLEGVALSASILQYLKDKIKLAVVTSHYADLTHLKEHDPRFENAAMEFSLKTLQPTYQILWGSRGDSNALSIAKSIGFNYNIIERAHVWVEKLRPEKLKMRQSSVYQSLTEERNRIHDQAKRAASLHSEIMNLYLEIRNEVDDLERREAALMAQETQKVKEELTIAKSQIETVLQQLEDQLRTTSPDQYGLLIKKTESSVASIIEAHCPRDDLSVRKGNGSTYTPHIREQVYVKSLGNKLATVVETSGDDDTVLVQYGKIRVRVDKRNITALRANKMNAAKRSVQPLSLRVQNSRKSNDLADKRSDVEVSNAPVFQTSKNTVDLRGMRVEEASHFLNMAIDSTGSNSVLFIIHGMGTGAVKESAIDILKKHRRVSKFEQKMLAVFGKETGNPPEELSNPLKAVMDSKSGAELVETFHSWWPDSTLYNLSNGNFMALSHEGEKPLYPRSIVVMDDIYCIFIGMLENTTELRRHYGLSRQATEATVIVEAFKVLRDRAPYPLDQVIKDLKGKFAFVLFDARANTLFVARDREGCIPLQWGKARDGSLVCSDNPKIISEACGNCYTPFPPGCIFLSEIGLISFDHPLNKVRGITRENDDGNISAVIFHVDLFTRLYSIPRTGSAANWAGATAVEGE